LSNFPPSGDRDRDEELTFVKSQNRSMEILDAKIKEQVAEVIKQLLGNT